MSVLLAAGREHEEWRNGEYECYSSFGARLWGIGTGTLISVQLELVTECKTLKTMAVEGSALIHELNRCIIYPQRQPTWKA